MADPRIERLAELIVGYSLGLGPGRLLRIDGHEVASPLIVAMHRAALAAGANAYARVGLDGLDELVLAEASEEQLTYLSPIEWREVEAVDAIVTIWSETNTRSMSRADPGRLARWIATQRKLANRRWERVSRGDMRWCGTLMPTQAHAQDAEMSLVEYEQFAFGACHVLDGEDPVAHWKGTSAELRAHASELEQARELRIVGPDTDLTVGVEGRGWRAADGHLNMPDGEVFTSPLETATEGEIRFSFPAIFHGREVEDVRLRFEGGRVVDCEAARGVEHLRAMLDMDDGARRLGEVAFGLNYEIDRFTRNILFDEKIGGTMHLALGSSFPELGGRNESGLHWDMICDLRADGEVYADGELVWRAGSFLGQPEPAQRV
jgi:aminopeptidase